MAHISKTKFRLNQSVIACTGQLHVPGDLDLGSQGGKTLADKSAHLLSFTGRRSQNACGLDV